MTPQSPHTAKWDPPIAEKIERLVVGCISTDFYDKILFEKLSPRSTAALRAKKQAFFLRPKKELLADTGDLRSISGGRSVNVR